MTGPYVMVLQLDSQADYHEVSKVANELHRNLKENDELQVVKGWVALDRDAEQVLDVFAGKKRHPVGVGTATFIVRDHPDDDTVLQALLIQRGEGCSHGVGTWSLPGGWMEYGESYAEAARREVMEEVGLEISFNSDRGATPLGSTDYVFPDNGVHSVCFYLSASPISTDEPIITETTKISAWEWVDVDKIKDKPLFAHLAKAIESIPYLLEIL